MVLSGSKGFFLKKKTSAKLVSITKQVLVTIAFYVVGIIMSVLISTL